MIIYHISSGYVKLTAWNGKGNHRRFCVETCVPNTGMTRKQRWDALRYFLADRSVTIEPYEPSTRERRARK